MAIFRKVVYGKFWLVFEKTNTIPIAVICSLLAVADCGH